MLIHRLQTSKKQDSRDESLVPKIRSQKIHICHITSQWIREALPAFATIKKYAFQGRQKIRESTWPETRTKSQAPTVCLQKIPFITAPSQPHSSWWFQEAWSGLKIW